MKEKMYNFDVLPDAKEFEKLSGIYARVPVTGEFNADTETPVTLFLRYKDREDCFLLESAEDGSRQSRYSFIGFKPFCTLYTKDSTTYIEEKEKEKEKGKVKGNAVSTLSGNPFDILSNMIKKNSSPHLKDQPPLTGGAVGYLSYDMARYAEYLPDTPEDKMGFPDMYFMFMDEIITYDHLRHKLLITVCTKTEGNGSRNYLSAIERIKAIYNEIRTLSWKADNSRLSGKALYVENPAVSGKSVGNVHAKGSQQVFTDASGDILNLKTTSGSETTAGFSTASGSGIILSSEEAPAGSETTAGFSTTSGSETASDSYSNEKTLPHVTSSVSSQEFCKMVECAKKHIYDGDIFQVVLSQHIEVTGNIDPFQVYRELRVLNPSPYMYYFKMGEQHISGSSPEMLARLNGNLLETCPIAGTRKRGRTREEDSLLERELNDDPKEKAEHIMLVDLGRNDIGRVSEFGSVNVDKFMKVEYYSHVMHLKSLISGKLANGLTAVDALRSVLPAGTLSGAPKIKAMQIIDRLEKTKRGPYGGTAGYISFDGTMDSCIVIRTVYFCNGKAYIRAGAGIVADSIPQKEYEECRHKAEALLRAIEASSGKITEEAEA